MGLDMPLAGLSVFFDVYIHGLCIAGLPAPAGADALAAPEVYQPQGHHLSYPGRARAHLLLSHGVGSVQIFSHFHLAVVPI